MGHSLRCQRLRGGSGKPPSHGLRAPHVGRDDVRPAGGLQQQAFCEEHAEIILYTPDRTLHLEPVLVNVINANKKNVRLSFGDQEELEEYMAAEEAESEVVLDGYRSGRQVFAFVTCSYETSNSRTVSMRWRPNHDSRSILRSRHGHGSLRSSVLLLHQGWLDE